MEYQVYLLKYPEVSTGEYLGSINTKECPGNRDILKSLRQFTVRELEDHIENVLDTVDETRVYIKDTMDDGSYLTVGFIGTQHPWFGLCRVSH